MTKIILGWEVDVDMNGRSEVKVLNSLGYNCEIVYDKTIKDNLG